MLRSMTGFGRGAAREGAVEATVEVRSVNARFVDVSVYTPRILSSYEGEIQRVAKKRLNRGKVSVSVSLKEDDVSTASQINGKAIQDRMALLRAVREEAGLSPEEAPITLDILLQEDSLLVPDIDEEKRASSAWEATRAALRDSLGALEEMSLQEGRAMQEDLEGRVSEIESSVEIIEKRAPERIREARVRLRETLSDLVDDERLDPGRLEMEIAILADKRDITEECVRLRSHLAQFREALENEKPVGRRLNFLCQELNREINTIGSKANDAEITRLSIAMKEELEKIREQVQNVV